MPLIRSQHNHVCSRVHTLHVCVFCGSRVRCLLIERQCSALLDELLWNCSCNLAVSTDHLPVLMQALRGQVLRRSMDAHGCRLVQRALALADDAGRVEIAQELRGHICEVLESPHGNYVLQRIIELMRPSVVSFVLGELTACMTPQELAKHRYGCRILERII